MRRLIEQIRSAMPFDLPEAQMCQGPCDGCSMKLLAYLEPELDGWEQRLNEGDIPTLGDIDRLTRTARKIHKIMVRNGLVME